MRKGRASCLLLLASVVCVARQPASAQGSIQAEFAATNAALVRDAGRLLQADQPPNAADVRVVSSPSDPPPHPVAARAQTVTAHSAWSSTLVPLLVAEGVPAEAIAVMQVESGGNPRALSAKGARGLWQLMPETARRYGLRVGVGNLTADRADTIADERLDPVRSTQAAARYLHDLYMRFGSWPLALAAYNWGEQHVEEAVAASGAHDFATLVAVSHLPLETRAYVPAVLARWGAATRSRTDARPAVVTYATGRESDPADGPASVQATPPPTPQGN